MTKRPNLALVPLLALTFAACAEETVTAPAFEASFATWTGNGTTAGACDQIVDYDGTNLPGFENPEPGLYWHFVNNQVTGVCSNSLNAAFSDGESVVGASATLTSSRTHHFYFGPTDADAKLLSASTACNGRLVVSHCVLVLAPQWCSPGYWRQDHHLDSWSATGHSPDDLYNDHISDPAVAGNPTLWDVLQSPQTYSGEAFNAVGDLLSYAHPDVNFGGNRVEDSCPLN